MVGGVVAEVLVGLEIAVLAVVVVEEVAEPRVVFAPRRVFQPLHPKDFECVGLRERATAQGPRVAVARLLLWPRGAGAAAGVVLRRQGRVVQCERRRV